MRKVIYSLLLVVVGIMLVSCEKEVTTNYTEYHLYQQFISHIYYYKIPSIEELNEFNSKYTGIGDLSNIYSDSFFKENSLFVFLIAEGSGGNRHKLYYDNITNDGTLVIKYKRTNEGMTDDMAYWHVFFELPKSTAKKVNKIEIQTNNYNTVYNDIETAESLYPEVMPSDTRLFISVYNGINFSYDSSDNELYESCHNKVIYELSKEELNDIYQSLRNIKFDSYPESLYVSQERKYHMSIYLDCGNVNGSCHINNIPSFEEGSWENHSDLENVVIYILSKYFLNTDEYKELVNNIDK